jgi:la-related protein 1
MPNGFFPPHHPTYYPGYEMYQPPVQAPVHAPVSVPLSAVPFPLDPIRSQLLGQLEYYLSPQNMVSDYFLRQQVRRLRFPLTAAGLFYLQMDSRGWIPIPLISNFKRVQQLTVDMQLVKDVLTLSTLAEVYENWVRMKGWERFVLPDAQPSKVEAMPCASMETREEKLGGGAEERYVDVDEDDEEDVVFVMGKEAEWTPELQRG